MELLLQGHAVQLKHFHDLSFVEGYGRVFKVFDQLSSGMLCFGMEGEQGRLFLKYAGAPCINYPSSPLQAIDKLRRAAGYYDALRHPMLMDLMAQQELKDGLLLIFRWEDGLPLSPIPQHYLSFRSSALLRRLHLYDALLDLQVRAERLGLLIGGLSDNHLLYDAALKTLKLSNLDDYQDLPCYNQRGRLAGSPYYLPPEAYQQGAALDESSNVYMMGALSFAFFGDRKQKSKGRWEAPPATLGVAQKAIREKPQQRFQSLLDYQQAWRAAVLESPMA